MSLHTRRLHRRTVLKGLGVSLALPWLEGLRPAAALAAPEAAAAATPPLRMAFLFVPNGMHMPDWTPKVEGYGFDLPYVLEPLAEHHEDLLVLSGLTHDKGRANGDGPGDHARSASAFLTGSQPRKTDGSNIRVGISVDQYAAQQVGHATRFPSLELGCERGRDAGGCDSGYSCAYSNNISWASETTPVGKEVDPRLVFERLFSKGPRGQSDESRARREALRKSILDFVGDDAKRLQSQLGANDRRKLDEYLSGVREIERRIELSENENAPAAGPRGYRRPAGVPKEYEDHLRLMCDMLALAFQTDSTRIATFMLANEGSNRSYRDIGVPDGHHDLSHHGGDPKKHAKIREINRFHVAQFAYLLEKLKSVREGEGTLLDNCMIVYGAGISDGNRHNNENLPIVMAGRGAGTIDPGRHVRYEYETPMTNLFLSMLDRMGAPAEYLGDSTGRLAGLQV
ncbi:MAG TPA: DUF1552 domain-containing protein [Planctomycetaceae bacterium]|nr:DUF1552 domain-containing protein [Planctomycetaceae bacterium]